MSGTDRPESAEEGSAGNRVTPRDPGEAYRASERVRVVAAIPHRGDCRFPDRLCTCGVVADRRRVLGLEPETERVGALVVQTRGPWSEQERPELAEIQAVTDWGPWAQHNFPCPVCKRWPARVDIGGWVFGPCGMCQAEGWELRRRPRRWWQRLTRG
jgi:hypothetical protein